MDAGGGTEKTPNSANSTGSSCSWFISGNETETELARQPSQPEVDSEAETRMTPLLEMYKERKLASARAKAQPVAQARDLTDINIPKSKNRVFCLQAVRRRP
jgi:hypothetical protein